MKTDIRRFAANRRPLMLAILVLGLFLSKSSFCFGEDPVFPNPERIRYNARSFLIDGKPLFIYSGAFHYFRVPKELWADRFAKMKEAGFNAVETYVPWNYHERTPPADPKDFSKLSGLDDLEEWITMAEKHGLLVTIRPGPYICAEWSGGGFPQWLVSLKKPAGWPAGTSWLQTDDPLYLEWTRHWYEAVARVVAPHQITGKPAGSPGVMLFQIENEYERLKWIPKEVKKRQLEALATCARANCIEVPLVTCWTVESRNVKEGPLHGVVDFVNVYPKWAVREKMDKYTSRQLKDQPDAPLCSMELQGGWYSAIGGKLSREIEGHAPVQTQNLTLYALQLGYSMINYYMLVGGSNFDDWASREATQTYDFAAAIGEDGSTGERYRRLASIGAMLRKHGVALISSSPVGIECTSTDPLVEVAERRAPGGGRYFFVRTEERKSPHTGTVTIKEKDSGGVLTFRFDLEPFGSRILYLPPGVTDAEKGLWLPEKIEGTPAPHQAMRVIPVVEAERSAAFLPNDWTPLVPGDIPEKHGIFDRHFLFYKFPAVPGKTVTVKLIGDKEIGDTPADAVLMYAGGSLVSPSSKNSNSVTFTIPEGAHVDFLLHESRGLHQHTTPLLEQTWNLAPVSVTSEGTPVPLSFSSIERSKGIDLSSRPDAEFPGAVRVVIDQGETAPPSLLTWYRFSFVLPSNAGKNSVRLRLTAAGNGFLYVNGHCLGRYWEEGPQHEFVIPATWLNPAGQPNVVALSLRPMGGVTALREAALLYRNEGR